MFPIGLFSHLDGLRLEETIIYVKRIVLIIASDSSTNVCPDCSQLSHRLHSHYWRTLHDLSWADNNVTLRLRVRRFRCSNSSCTRKIFAERFPKLADVRARRTHLQKHALEHLGFALGGSAGARLSERLGLAGSRSTILRLVYAAPFPKPPAPLVIGVDDWARRKGQRYGTILVDLERHKPIDLLADRTSETLAAWLRAHPSIEVISRDRGGTYAEGARQGAPNAIQVADRFHLLVNISEVIERVLSRKHHCLKEAAANVDRCVAQDHDNQETINVKPPAETTHERLTKAEQLRQEHRARRLERYNAVMALHWQGISQRVISRQLGLTRITVRRYISADGFPELASRPKKPTNLTPYEPYLRERWTAGCHNAGVLWREIRERGFSGSRSTVRVFLASWRTAPGRCGRTPRNAEGNSSSPTPPAVQPTRTLSSRHARWLLLRQPDDLDLDELVYREQLLLTSDELRTAWSLADSFIGIVRERNHLALEPWLKKAEHSAVREFRDFAVVLRRDLAAATAALVHPWSNGQTEGQINWLKMLKRQMYGRASIELLKRRFVMAA